MSIYKIFVAALIVCFAGCTWFKAKNMRETIFDRIVSIPKAWVLDVPYLPPLCDEIPGLKKRFVEVTNGKLYVEEEGSGTPLLLVSGGPGETHHAFHPYFSQAKDFAHLIYYDQRGTGQSSIDETGATYTIKQAVEDIERMRKALNIECWVVLGWSYGGFLAQCYALTYPEHVKGLILVASGDGLKNVTMKPTRQQMFLSKAEQDAIRAISAADGSGKLTALQTIYNKGLAGDWKRQHYYKPTPDQFIRAARYNWKPAPGFNEMLSTEMSHIALDGKFDDFEIPTLLLEGKWDLTWDTDKAEFMRKNHPHAQFEYFEKSGHCIFADEPEKFFALLKNFIEKASKSQIMYKPGNRLTWPTPPHPLLRQIAASGGSYLDYYDQALKENIQDANFWGNVAYELIKAKTEYAKCLAALQRVENIIRKTLPDLWAKVNGYSLLAWQGHMLDLLGNRQQAIQKYQEALQMIGDKRDDSFGGGIVIDKQWLQERLKTPFTWPKK